MRKFGQRHIEGFVDQHLLRRVRQMVIASNHVSNLHQRVIHHNGIVICRPSVGSKEYGIADDLAFKLHSAVHDVVKMNRALTHSKSNDGRLLFREAALDDFGFQ